MLQIKLPFSKAGEHTFSQHQCYIKQESLFRNYTHNKTSLDVPSCRLCMWQPHSPTLYWPYCWSKISPWMGQWKGWGTTWNPRTWSHSKMPVYVPQHKLYTHVSNTSTLVSLLSLLCGFLSQISVSHVITAVWAEIGKFSIPIYV